MVSVLEKLKARRELLARPGVWVNRFPRVLQGEGCLMVGPGHFSSSHAMDEEIRNTIGSGSLSIWNDAPGRTLAEVLAMLDATIARLEAERA